MKFIACQGEADARGSADIIYLTYVTHIASSWGQA